MHVSEVKMLKWSAEGAQSLFRNTFVDPCSQTFLCKPPLMFLWLKICQVILTNGQILILHLIIKQKNI